MKLDGHGGMCLWVMRTAWSCLLKSAGLGLPSISFPLNFPLLSSLVSNQKENKIASSVGNHSLPWWSLWDWPWGPFKWNHSSSYCFNNVALKLSSPLLQNIISMVVSWIVWAMPHYLFNVLIYSVLQKFPGKVRSERQSHLNKGRRQYLLHFILVRCFLLKKEFSSELH